MFGKYFISIIIFFIYHQLSYQVKIITKRDIIDDSISSKNEIEVTLSESDFEGASKIKEIDLKSIGINVPNDPTMGKKTEGDIAIKNMKLFVQNSNGLARNAIRQKYRRWPNGEIPYALSSKYGSYAKSIIAKAMDEYHKKTCIRFVPRDPMRHVDYIYIHPDDGCYSLVGKVGGRQPLSLDSGCIQTGTIVHELMHTVGFFHEQSRNDRDNYIKIIWENVMNGADDQFEKYGINVIDNLNEPYDYNSIMHYGPYAFSANGKRTISPYQANSDKMGQRIEFSPTDLRKIKKLYECNNYGSNGNIDNSINQACEDLNWRCNFWSIGLFNYCDRYEEVRNVICRFSCGTCKINFETFGGRNILNEDINEGCFDRVSFCRNITPSFHCRIPKLATKCPVRCRLC
ncbi:Astacin-like metalloendopeptidase [Strongyloides ratti]|uniref:Metalloendopeptidase n=1 Tax=Strongyloides ratti TaxID=34506 RepID=A0A090L8A5_STRRB|nr:Astacin-like metalloendopeptidase [Strongyloides ratti]CEF64358.1 Astacin-like metalloendopeptidase [Strongyloides ratti]